jgi:O-succinylbenzoate synthase
MLKKKSTWIVIAIALIVIIGVAGLSGKFAKAKVGAPAAAQDKLIVTFYLENTPDATIDAIL